MLNFAVVLMVAVAVAGCPDDKNCRTCVAGKCILCFDSVLKDDGTCDASIKLIAHCSIYLKDGNDAKCLACAPGYYADQNASSCSRCSQSNCAACTSGADSCSACFWGYLAKDNKCSSDKINDSNCLIAKDAQSCIVCNSGYSVDPNYKCGKGPAGCLMMLSENTCAVCHDGAYITADNKCSGTPKPIPDFGSRWWLWLLVILLILLIAGLLYYFLVVKKNQNAPPAEADYARAN